MNCPRGTKKTNRIVRARARWGGNSFILRAVLVRVGEVFSVRFYIEEVHGDSCRTSSPDHDHPWSLTAPPSPSRPGTLVVPEPRSPVVPHVHVGPRRPRTTSTSGWPLTYGPPGSSHTVLEDPPQRHNDTGHLKMEDTGGTTIRTCLRWPSCVLPVLVAFRKERSFLPVLSIICSRVKRVPPV